MKEPEQTDILKWLDWYLSKESAKSPDLDKDEGCQVDATTELPRMGR